MTCLLQLVVLLCLGMTDHGVHLISQTLVHYRRENLIRQHAHCELLQHAHTKMSGACTFTAMLLLLHYIFIFSVDEGLRRVSLCSYTDSKADMTLHHAAELL